MSFNTDIDKCVDSGSLFIVPLPSLFSVKKIKTKFHSLRTSYGREKKWVDACMKSGAGTEAIYVSKWAHYKSLHFLNDTLNADKSIDSFQMMSSVSIDTMIPPGVCTRNTLIIKVWNIFVSL